MYAAAYALMASTFTTYPAFIEQGATLEALTDKGLIVEVIVRCPEGAGIITYSKVERQFCTPDFSCYSRINSAVQHLCR